MSECHIFEWIVPSRIVYFPHQLNLEAIDVWMVLCLMFVCGAFIEYSVVNVLARKDKRVLDKEVLSRKVGGWVGAKVVVEWWLSSGRVVVEVIHEICILWVNDFFLMEFC